MTRIPLRPLARILEAREKGENPDAIERENRGLRNARIREGARARSEGRLVVLAGLFFCAFLVVGGRMAAVSASVPSEPRVQTQGAAIVMARADITDRNGRILATNLATHALYAQPQQMVDKALAARELARIFPDLDEARLYERFTGPAKFLWIKRTLSPEQKQAVFDIGEPGLMFGPREMRLYPNGPIMAHVLGGAGFGREGVNAAEVIGVAGVERRFDTFLRDPANNGAALALSLDLTVQAAVERVLDGGMRMMDAKGAAAVLMDVRTGEVISLVSLPDFDPNHRPAPLTEGRQEDSPLFNRAVQGLYELGSTFKLFAVAQALELGLVTPDSMIETRGPLTWGRYTIRDFHDYGPELSVTDVLVKSSNIGTAKIAGMIGPLRQQAFLAELGLTTPPLIELSEAPGVQPLLPDNWSDLSAMTISYGHGLSASPLHLAAAYASLVGDGTRVTPTLLRAEAPTGGARLVSPEVSGILRDTLRDVVRRGTATLGEVPGYEVGGKTGSADKHRPGGGYYDDRVIATFVSVFPATDPAYVLVVTLDEPVETSGAEPRRTAGWTAVPVAAEIIRRAAPLLGLRPEIAPVRPTGVTLTSN